MELKYKKWKLTQYQKAAEKLAVNIYSYSYNHFGK